MSLSTSKSSQTSPETYKKLTHINYNQNSIYSNNIEPAHSVYSEDYKLRKMLDRPLPYLPKNQIELSTDKFNCHSSYGDEFVLKPISKTKSLKPLTTYVVPTETFHLDTNYNTDFRRKISERGFIIKPKDSLVCTNDSTENCLSSYTNDFVKKDIKKVQSFSPENIYSPSKPYEKMLSSYQTEFVEVHGPPTKLLRSFVSYEKPSESLQTDTTYKTEFNKSKSYSPTKSFRPENTFKSPDIPFHVSTNYTENFKNSNEKIIRPFSFKPKTEFKKPEEPFNTGTSYLYDYQKQPKVLEKIQSFRPKENLNISAEPLNVKSSYLTEFPLNEVSSKLAPIKPINHIQISQEKIDYSTAYGTNYNTSSRRVSTQGTQTYQF